MRLTRFTDYSLRVLIYLGQNNQNRVTIYQISEAYGISKNHLMKVVSNLTRLKFVSAQRGPGGGIRLNRKPEEISLNDIIRHTEKHLDQNDEACLYDKQGLSADNRLKGYLHNAMQAYLEALGRFTLADVLDPRTETVQLLDLSEKAA
ncbi:MAG: Rrf2 family transcriptional regulator [Xanthomonadales bacterium]|nr:Rrf2 family transcriptional regulator [Xanthomonadales bacterium]MDH4018199.1 Rrf2 family transcriptional regulator [Xanthomonadales bacterium]